MSTNTASTASSLLIAQIARAMRRRFEETVAPIGLRPRQLLALHHLRERGPTAQQQLVEALAIDATNVVAVLNELEDAGLVERRRDRADRRRAIVELSPAGERLLDELDRALHRIDDELLGSLSPAERRHLNDLLTRAAESVAGDCAPVDDDAC